MPVGRADGTSWGRRPMAAQGHACALPGSLRTSTVLPAAGRIRAPGRPRCPCPWRPWCCRTAGTGGRGGTPASMPGAGVGHDQTVGTRSRACRWRRQLRRLIPTPSEWRRRVLRVADHVLDDRRQPLGIGCDQSVGCVSRRPAAAGAPWQRCARPARASSPSSTSARAALRSRRCSCSISRVMRSDRVARSCRSRRR